VHKNTDMGNLQQNIPVFILLQVLLQSPIERVGHYVESKPSLHMPT